MVETHVQEGRSRSLSERALRNRRVAAETYLGFLRTRHGAPSETRMRTTSASAPSEPRMPTPAANGRAEKRRARRVPFITGVRVDDYGVRRSADISTGGIYLEMLTTAAPGSSVRLRFKLHAADREPITAIARVSFVLPQFGSGLEFLSMAPMDVLRIADFVAVASAWAATTGR